MIDRTFAALAGEGSLRGIHLAGGEATLESTSHFHIDPYGNLFTGYCPGISVADIDDFHPELSAESAPVYLCLLQGGPHAVWKNLADGFEPDPLGYISRCHLCLDVRQYLRRAEDYVELCPDDYYA